MPQVAGLPPVGSGCQSHAFRIAGGSNDAQVAARPQQERSEANLVQQSCHRLDDLYCLLEPRMQPPGLFRQQQRLHPQPALTHYLLGLLLVGEGRDHELPVGVDPEPLSVFVDLDPLAQPVKRDAALHTDRGRLPADAYRASDGRRHLRAGANGR